MRRNLFCKTLAVVLSVVFLLSTVFFAGITVFVAVAGGYTQGYDILHEDAMNGVLRSYAYEVADAYERGEDISALYDDSNFYYEISGVDISEGNCASDEYVRTVTVNRRYRDYSSEPETGEDVAAVTTAVYDVATESPTEFETEAEGEPKPVKEWVNYTVTLYEKADKDALDFLLLAEFAFEFSHDMRYAAPVIAVVSLIFFIVTLIFLFSAAGHRKGTSEPMLNRVDRIPFDLYTVICGCVIIFAFAGAVLLFEIIWYNTYLSLAETLLVWAASSTGILLVAIVAYLVALGYLLSFATRVKVGGLIRRTLIYKIVAFIFGIIGKIFRGIFKLFAAIPLVWKTVLIFFGVSLLELILFVCNLYEADNLTLLWMAEKIIHFPIIIGIALLLRKLQKGGEAIAAGRINEKIDTKYMPLDFGKFGRTLNNIGDGLSNAVDERMKSERMKTELITNVSHDIKTPLTSIVNYVDLIKKEELESETLREYVDVLDRQSARLKKLIDDLVEASKASTGNISVEVEKCDVGVLLEQSLGEYEEKLSEKALTPIVTTPDEPVFILADGRRLWRVFDNLLNNICKYALSDTRVYIDLKKEDKTAVITFRNISREPLNISSDELMERFVRGDTSRNTEGSGLGLSIARSLTELQGGTLDLSIDGDLFKAILTFNTAE